jgi:hypothetical protein
VGLSKVSSSEDPEFSCDFFFVISAYEGGEEVPNGEPDWDASALTFSFSRGKICCSASSTVGAGVSGAELRISNGFLEAFDF